MKIKDTLTIIVPLYGREELTIQFLRYLQYIKCPFKVLFADGGETDLSDLVNKGMFPDVDLEYHRYPPDEDISSYMRKMKDIYSKVTTPLTVMMDNDDLFCLNGLYEGIEFLAENEDYWSYREDVRDIIIGNDGPIVEGSPYQYPSITSDDPVSRVSSAITQRNALWHDITRTSVHQEFFDLMAALEVNDLQLVVSLQCYYSPIFGKAYRSATKPYYFHIPGASTIQGTGKLTRYVDWMHSEFFDVSMAQAVSIVGNALAHHHKLDAHEAKKSFADVFFKHLLETTNKEKGPLDEIPKLTDEFISKYLEASEDFDSIVSASLGGYKKSQQFSLDEQIAVHFNYDQLYTDIINFRNHSSIAPDYYINVLGDSHTRSFSYSTNYFPIFVGPGKEVNFTTDAHAEETTIRLINNALRLNPGSHLMFVFGEPDIRLYLENFEGIQDLETEDEYVESATNRYLNTLLTLRTALYEANPGFDVAPRKTKSKFIVYNAVPGPRLEQNLLSIKYNKRLQSLCEENNIQFVDIWEQVTDNNSEVNEDYSVDHIHLNEKVIPIVNQQLKDQKLLYPFAEDDVDYVWSYFYKFYIEGKESRIWGDAPKDKKEKFERSNEVGGALASLEAQFYTQAAAHGIELDNPKILLLQCGEGFPAHCIRSSATKPLQIFATDTDKDTITMARRVQSYSNLQNTIFGHLKLHELKLLNWEQFDLVIYLKQDDEDVNAKFYWLLENMNPKMATVI